KELKPTLKNCYEHVSEFKTELATGSPLILDTLKYAKELEGNVRNTGVHACGVIIGRDPITDWVPVSTAADKDGTKLLVTQYEGSVIEDTGLIKMDFLGLKTLSIIKEALANIKLTHGIDVDIDNIPIDDPKTYQLYCEGHTTGTFQFESAGMQKYLRELQPSTFEDLIAMNALYRPGPMDYIPDFINRKHGKSPISYDIPVMEKYLKDTYGVTVYQEQVMLLSRLLANFTRGQSDTLRKAMGKKMIDKMNELKSKFIAGGNKNGYETEVLEKIWADWEKFASYAFNKSHATCYSWVAYQTAYLKANFPAEYMAAVLSRNLADITKLTGFMDECKAMKIEVKGPDVNESFTKFGVNRQGDIRFGLAAIKGIGTNVVNDIIAAREEGGPFTSIYDFVERVNLSSLNRRTIESLALAGAFDCFEGLDREDFFAKNNKDESFTEVIIRYGQLFQNDKKQKSASLFGDEDESLTIAARPEPIKGEKWSDIERLNKEKDLVGMYLSAHPLDTYFMEINYGCGTIKELIEGEPAEGKEIAIGGIVTGYETRMTKKGGQFGILKIEDYTGSTELKFFGQDFIEFNKYGHVGIAIRVHGRFQKRYNSEELVFKVTNIKLLQDIKGQVISNITLQINKDDITPELHELLVDLIKSSTEDRCTLQIEITDESIGRTITLTSGVKIPVNKKLIDKLNQQRINFTINQ
ncbi:MAG: DNA polymerase III subunit alpha, partial [Muribaculaceae bacterium]|nr:DNA polymerase III subunit alpha [Muribaculaceae bacterium]